MGRHVTTRGEQRAGSSKKNSALGIQEVKRWYDERCKEGAKHRDDERRYKILKI